MFLNLGVPSDCALQECLRTFYVLPVSANVPTNPPWPRLVPQNPAYRAAIRTRGMRGGKKTRSNLAYLHLVVEPPMPWQVPHPGFCTIALGNSFEGPGPSL